MDIPKYVFYILNFSNFTFSSFKMDIFNVMKSFVLQTFIACELVGVCQHMVRSIKEEHGIKCRRHKRFKVTTDSTRNKLIYPNVLDQKFNASRPNQAWVIDITYIWTLEGWLYLAGVKDLYTKELVGYAINKRMTVDLVCQALNVVIKNKRPSKGLVIHSDRGSQYCSHTYHKVIKQHQFTGSMSGKGNCFDNAPIESFWGVLKNEPVYHQNYKTRFAAINDTLDILSCIIIRLEFKKAWAINRQDSDGLTFIIWLRN